MVVVSEEAINEFEALMEEGIRFPKLSKSYDDTFNQLVQAYQGELESMAVNLVEENESLLIEKDILVGDACFKWRHQLDISHPVNNGIMQNWDDMEHVWDHSLV